jgi:Uma2 family endonuclease
VRSPDVSFVRADRLPDGQAPEGFAEFLPDLAIEIVSPTDRAPEIAEKIGEYLAHGVQTVWLVEPRNQTITVYHSMTDVMTFNATEELRGDPVLPGFSCRVQQVFI